jgi:hypothetical protein
VDGKARAGQLRREARLIRAWIRDVCGQKKVRLHEIKAELAAISRRNGGTGGNSVSR